MGPVQVTDDHGPLGGLRVLELGSFIAGPLAGQLLGDYGAEIIKIEPPGVGDAMRHWGVTRDGTSLWWPTIARNKKSVALDLRIPAGQRLARVLATRCDIVLENFRPGRLRAWGLDYATLAVENPGLIMVHVSGFGQTGPRATAAGFGSIGEAFGGIRHTTGDPDRSPARCGISLGAQLASLFAVIGALAALSERHRSGAGQEVDVAVYEAVFALMESSLADFELADIVRSRSGSTLPGVAPSNAYPTSDGADVIIAANADAVFRRLCEADGSHGPGSRRALQHPCGSRPAHDRAGQDRRWLVSVRVRRLGARCTRCGRGPGEPSVHGGGHARRRAVPRAGHGAKIAIARGLASPDEWRRANLHAHRRCDS